MQNKIPIIVLVGPTAVGKTELGIKLAQQLNTEIIVADSMQIYRYLDIGTAKPTLEQQQPVKHYMLDVVNPDEPFNAAMYSQQAESIAKNLSQQKKIPLVIGGTGLYIRALIDGIFAQPKIDALWRDNFKKDNASKSAMDLHLELNQLDELTASRIHPNDRRRILRALEVFHYCHIPISLLQKEQREQGTIFHPLFFGLKLEMQNLYDRINARVNRMLDQGWINEVEALRNKGYSAKLLSMQGLGYRHINSFLDNKLSYGQMVYFIKRDTRHYAKRQMTWFRANQRIQWFDSGSQSSEEIVNQIVHQAK